MIAHFVPIRKQTWPPQAIIVPDWSISTASSLKLLDQMNQNLVGCIYGRSSITIAQFVPILANMAATCNTCFLLVDF